MNALGVLTIMSLLAPAPGPAAPFSIHEDVDEGNTTTTASSPTAASAASAAAEIAETAAGISPSDAPTLIRVTEPSADPSESNKNSLTFTASPELGPIHEEESEHTGRHAHAILQRGPSPLAASEPDDLDADVYSSPGSLTAMAGASALRSRRPLLSPVRTAGLSAYASTPIKFEGESEDTHGHSDDTVVTALRGHYTMNTESPYNQHIALIAHQLGHDGGATSTDFSGTSGAVAGPSDSGTDQDEHQTFPTISSLGDHHVYPPIGGIPYEHAKPIGPHVETISVSHKPLHKPKDLHVKKGWSKHWKTALRMLAGLAPLALLLAALPPNVLIVNPTQNVNRTTAPYYNRGRTADVDDETLSDIASCHRVCEQLRAVLSTVRVGGRESWPGFGDVVAAARSPTCAESLCTPDGVAGGGAPTTTTTTTTAPTTRSSTSSPPHPHPHPLPTATTAEAGAAETQETSNKKILVKKYLKAIKRRKTHQVAPISLHEATKQPISA